MFECLKDCLPVLDGAVDHAAQGRILSSELFEIFGVDRGHANQRFHLIDRFVVKQHKGVEAPGFIHGMIFGLGRADRLRIDESEIFVGQLRAHDL
jgi:hypothetical protein